MDTQKAVKRLRLHEWLEMVKERMESGQNIKTFCKEKGISEATYYYRQQQVRIAACTAMGDNQAGLSVSAKQNYPVTQSGWAQVTEVIPTSDNKHPIYIEVSGCKIEVPQGVDMELLARICRVLKSL